MSELPDPIPFHALFAVDDRRPNPEIAGDLQTWLRQADLIFGTDVMSGQSFIVYGREIVERIASGAAPGEDVHILNIALDQETPELKRLLELVADAKGRHDYLGRA